MCRRPTHAHTFALRSLDALRDGSACGERKHLIRSPTREQADTGRLRVAATRSSAGVATMDAAGTRGAARGGPAQCSRALEKHPKTRHDGACGASDTGLRSRGRVADMLTHRFRFRFRKPLWIASQHPHVHRNMTRHLRPADYRRSASGGPQGAAPAAVAAPRRPGKGARTSPAAAAMPSAANRDAVR